MQSDREKIRALEARRSGMDEEFNHIRPIYEEIQDQMQPNRGRFNIGRRTRAEYNKKIIDGSARRAHRTLVSGLMAGVSSPSRPWFKLGVHDSGAQGDYEVKQWLHTVQSRMYDVIRESNTYRMFKQCYADLATFGVFGGLMVGDFDNVIHTHSFPVGLFRFGMDEQDRVNAMHYSCEKTVKQLVDRFGEDKVSNQTRNLYRQNKLYQKVKIHHAVEERLERDPMSPFATDMPIASYYWESGQQNFLAEGGYGTNNILAPRWDQVDSEPWPTEWPALLALGDAVQLQMQHRDKARAIQTSYNPPMVAPAGFSKRFRNVPGGITTMNTTDLQRGGLRPAVEVRPDVNALMMDIQETQNRISSCYFEDLFLMTSMSDRRQVTATEIAERHEEKLLVLGPVLESLDFELLSRVIEATFHYMMEADLIPDAPEALVGAPIKVEYVSLLAQAQKAVGVAAIERTLGFAGSLAQLKPEVIDLLSADDMMREFVDQIGPPPNTLSSPMDVEQIRQARAQQMQQEKMMEAAEPMANAAKLISEANARGVEGMGRGVPL